MHERYHEILKPVRRMASETVDLIFRATDKLLVGRSQPTHIQDLGKTVNQARPVQLVIEGMNIERTDIAQLGRTAVNRSDDMGTMDYE